MKTLSADQEAQRTAVGNSVAYLVEIDLPISGTRRYATRAVTVGGNTYLPLLRDHDGFRRVLPTDVVDAETYPADNARIALMNIPEDANRPELFLDTDRWEGAVVRVYMIFVTGDTLDDDDRIPVHTYTIEDIELSASLMHVRLADFALGVFERRIGRAVTRQLFPRADPASVGKVLPHVFGDVKACPLVAIDVGHYALTNGSMTATQRYVDVRELETVDPQSPHYFAPTPTTPVTIQIDAEQITVNSFNAAEKRLLVAADGRGAGGTTPTRHEDGSHVQEIRSEYLFAAACHGCNAVENVKAGTKPLAAGDYSTFRKVYGASGPYGGQAVQVVRLTSIPAWSERSDSVQQTRAEGIDTWLESPNNTASNAASVVTGLIRDPATIAAGQRLALNGRRNWTDANMGDPVKATLCVEYGANPKRAKLATTGLHEKIWQPGDFEIQLWRGGVLRQSTPLSAPSWSECQGYMDSSHTHNSGLSLPGPPTQSAKAAFYDAVASDKVQAGARNLTPADIDPWPENVTLIYVYHNVLYSVWLGDTQWADIITTQWIQTQGRFSVSRDMATGEDTVVRDQAFVLNGNNANGLWNFYLDGLIGWDILGYYHAAWQFFPGSSEWRASFSIPSLAPPATQQMQSRKLKAVHVSPTIWYPYWNTMREGSNGNLEVGIGSTVTGKKTSVQMSLPLNSYYLWVCPFDKAKLDHIGLDSIASLWEKGAYVFLRSQGAEVVVTADGASTFNMWLFTSMNVEVEWDDSLVGAYSDIVSDVYATSLEDPWASASQVTQRVDLNETLPTWIEQYGWDLFGSDTEIRVAAKGGVVPEVYVFNLWWEVEHRPAIQRSGFEGLVADVRGYETSGGALVRNPADIVSMLITGKVADGTAVVDAFEDADGQELVQKPFGDLDHATYLDGTTFEAARAELAAAFWHLSRRVEEDSQIRDLIGSACGESLLRLRFEGTQFYLSVLHDEVGNPVSGAPTLDNSLILQPPGREYTRMSEVANRLLLRYRWDYSNGREPLAMVVLPYILNVSPLRSRVLPYPVVLKFKHSAV